MKSSSFALACLVFALSVASTGAIADPRSDAVVDASEIDWIEAADYYVCLHCGGASHLLRETMDDIETRLDPQQFFRVHRSAIVNLSRVREIHPLFRGDCELRLADGAAVRLSRNRRRAFEARFAQVGSRGPN